MEPCQLEGLVKEGLVFDTDSQKFLLDEKCFCENQKFGCPEKPLWEELEVRHDFHYSPLPLLPLPPPPPPPTPHPTPPLSLPSLSPSLSFSAFC